MKARFEVTDAGKEAVARDVRQQAVAFGVTMVVMSVVVAVLACFAFVVRVVGAPRVWQ
jgi:hypothetical protein